MTSVIIALESVREWVVPIRDIIKVILSTKYSEIMKWITHHKITNEVFIMRKNFKEWAQDNKTMFEKVFHDERDLMSQGERKKKGKEEAKRTINSSLFTHSIF